MDNELYNEDFEACCENNKVVETTLTHTPIWNGMPRGHDWNEIVYTCSKCGKKVKEIK